MLMVVENGSIINRCSDLNKKSEIGGAKKIASIYDIFLLMGCSFGNVQHGIENLGLEFRKEDRAKNKYLGITQINVIFEAY